MSSKSANKNLRRSTREVPRKRKISKTAPIADPEPKRKQFGKKSQDGRDIDKYCWICHKADENSQANVCFTCPRVYHSACLEKGSHCFSDKNVCPECQLDSLDGTELSKSLTCRRLKELLLATTEQKISQKEYGKHKIFLSWPQTIGESEIVKVIDFQILIDKINDNVPYTKTSEFFSDLKWIQHNCYILYGASSKISDAAVKLVKAFKTDLLDLEACPDCYYHLLCSTSAHFFVRICVPPHDIIWAQVSGYPYWPAKCLKIVGGIAHVRFFGRHEIGNIPISQCYYISKEHPNHPQKSVPKTPKYKAAMIELYYYIGLYERTFGVGSFHYYPGKTAFKHEKAATKSKNNVPEETVSTTPPPPPPPPPTAKPNGQALLIDLSDDIDDLQNCDSPVLSSNDITVSTELTKEHNETISTNDSGVSADISTSKDPTCNTIQSNDVQACAPSPLPGPSSVIADGVSNNSKQMVTPQTIIPEKDTSTHDNTSDCNIMVHKSVRSCNGSDSQVSSQDDVLLFLDSLGSDPGHQCRPLTEEELVLPYLISKGNEVKYKKLSSLIHSLIAHIWFASNNAPSAPEILRTVLQEANHCKNMLLHTQKQRNETLSALENLQKVVKNLEVTLEEEKQKNEDLTMKFADATRNAKLIVNNIKSANNKIWSEKLDRCKSKGKKKLAEKDTLIAEHTELIEKLKADKIAIEAQKQEVEAEKQKIEEEKQALQTMYEEASNKLAKFTTCHKLSQETQTDLHHSDIFLRTDLDDDIIQAKINVFCQICFKPASIHCCISAFYCSKSCQKKHFPVHERVCQGKKETRSRLEPEIPQHPQFCQAMINQQNQSQILTRKTTSIHLQIEQSSNVITNSSKDTNLFVYPPASTSVNTPLNLMTTAPCPDRFTAKPALLPIPPGIPPSTTHIPVQRY